MMIQLARVLSHTHLFQPCDRIQKARLAVLQLGHGIFPLICSVDVVDRDCTEFVMVWFQTAQRIILMRCLMRVFIDGVTARFFISIYEEALIVEAAVHFYYLSQILE